MTQVCDLSMGLGDMEICNKCGGAVCMHAQTCTHTHTHRVMRERMAFPAGGAIHTDSTEPELSLAH